ncbi:cysteine-rich DPF motif domain-containing protein 1 isoform X2 [Bubalus bubalis]|uniref:cysteine-rich DPF motif domain-containing protein 1 isoform X2 n=1 Tax=Bubalus bubalis TaxID=89462 RepID=UPI001D0FE514|nr:cysteine-rich DPF motif domain-containing protein 1 isoform X2 [Bubalus bubalis]
MKGIQSRLFATPTTVAPPGSSVHGDSLDKNTGVGYHALLQGNLPNPGIEPRSPAARAESSPSEPPLKPSGRRRGSPPEAPPPPRRRPGQTVRAGPRTRPGLRLAAAEAAEMACETERTPLGVFKCQLCALTAPYSYQGRQPPDSQSVVLLEESYVMRDPFTPDKGRFLVVGSRCSICGRLECSLFYSKRFCLPCVQDNVDAFPQEIQQDLEKRKVPSTRPASQRSSQP